LSVILAANIWAAVIFPSGHTYMVELATTPQQWVQGLSGRETLYPARGMLFVFPQPQVQSFWMKNMKFPLDIVWLGEDFTVVGMEENIPPCKKDCPTYTSPVPVKYVLEVAAGTVKKEGLKVGDKLVVQFLPRRKI